MKKEKEPKKFIFKHGDKPIKVEKTDKRLHITVETKGAFGTRGTKIEEYKGPPLKTQHKMRKSTKIGKHITLSHNASDKIEKEIK